MTEIKQRSRDEIIRGVSIEVVWWIEQRRKKLVDLRHQTHAVNPFLWPLTMSMHGFSSFRELAVFQLAGHLVEGHATGFGKLIDEKILPRVFGTIKLDAKFRARTPELLRPEYDNIDHFIYGQDGSLSLLSVKAGRWSIQLGQAVQLNRSLQVLLANRDMGIASFDDIVVGVLYGAEEELTDKYRIIRGLPTRAAHDISNISTHVQIQAGRDFWSWLNGGNDETDAWVLEGIHEGLLESNRESGSLAAVYEEFIDDYAREYERFFRFGEPNWYGLLRDVNK